MEPTKLSKTLLRRLPQYLEYLRSLTGEDCRISATAIARALGMGDVQVRKDLAKIAGEGCCRTGRSRDQLIREIQEALTRSREFTAILVATTDMDRVLTEKGILASSGLDILACFDPELRRNREENGRTVYALSRLELFCRQYHVAVGIIAVTGDLAQKVCDCFIACGIREIRCVGAELLTVPDGIRLTNI